MQLVKNLNHPNIVKFYTIHTCNLTGINKGIQYNILMEYMDGGSLEKWIQENWEGFDLKDVKRITKQVLKGLEYLHKNKIIHWDIKP